MKGGFKLPITKLKQWSLLLLSGVAVVLLMSQLPSVERGFQRRHSTVPVFQPNKAIVLTDNNLVDLLANLPLQDQLVKVGWDHSILTVDILGEVPDAMWSDFGQFIVFSFGEVNNVKQVLIRVFADKGERRELLLAAEARKNEWTDKELDELKRSPLLADSNHILKFKLSVTPSGKRWIANFANS